MTLCWAFNTFYPLVSLNMTLQAVKKHNRAISTCLNRAVVATGCRSTSLHSGILTLCMWTHTIGWFNLGKPNCIQRTDTLDIWVSLGSCRSCSVTPSFSFMDLYEPLELLPELWCSSQTGNCLGMSSSYCSSVHVAWNLTKKKDRSALVGTWSAVAHHCTE